MWQFIRSEARPTMRRRLRFAVIIIISQGLLVALAVAWLIHMLLIAAYGSVYFVERNPFILWGEIVATIVITVFAVTVLVLQIQRLGERRRSEDRGQERRQQ
ncbi:MAG: hypothetical protein HY665_04615 [Chloroflexi bacterium]|nr:hypothetical protein [Chloroflexota bacterium]